jgi:hypothetical protein
VPPSLAQARLAKLGEYDEPFRAADQQPATYSRCAARSAVAAIAALLTSASIMRPVWATRSRAVTTLASLYRHAYDGHLLTVGLAAAASAACFLQAVDRRLE